MSMTTRPPILLNHQDNHDEEPDTINVNLRGTSDNTVEAEAQGLAGESKIVPRALRRSTADRPQRADTIEATSTSDSGIVPSFSVIQGRASDAQAQTAAEDAELPTTASIPILNLPPASDPHNGVNNHNLTSTSIPKPISSATSCGGGSDSGSGTDKIDGGDESTSREDTEATLTLAPPRTRLISAPMSISSRAHAYGILDGSFNGPGDREKYRIEAASIPGSVRDLQSLARSVGNGTLRPDRLVFGLSAVPGSGSSAGSGTSTVSAARAIGGLGPGLDAGAGAGAGAGDGRGVERDPSSFGGSTVRPIPGTRQLGANALRPPPGLESFDERLRHYPADLNLDLDLSHEHQDGIIVGSERVRSSISSTLRGLGAQRGIDELNVEWCFFCGRSRVREEMELKKVNLGFEIESGELEELWWKKSEEKQEERNMEGIELPQEGIKTSVGSSVDQIEVGRGSAAGQNQARSSDLSPQSPAANADQEVSGPKAAGPVSNSEEGKEGEGGTPQEEEDNSETHRPVEDDDEQGRRIDTEYEAGPKPGSDRLGRQATGWQWVCRGGCASFMPAVPIDGDGELGSGPEDEGDVDI